MWGKSLKENKVFWISKSKHTNLVGVVVGGMEKPRESVRLSGILDQEQKVFQPEEEFVQEQGDLSRVHSESSECD